MKRLLALMSYVVLAAACVGAQPAPSPTPPGSAPFLTPSPPPSPVDVPSGSCIFTLDVNNETGANVTVAANGTPLGDVAAHAARRFYAMMGGNPPLPWAVVITRTSDGTLLAAKDFPDGTLSGTIAVRDEPETNATGYCP